MLSVIFRIVWRFFIFALGFLVIWLMAFELYPYADSRLPAALVVFLFYCLLAYIVIPLLVRFFRLIIKPDHIPLYVTTGDGWPSDPVNIAIVVHHKDDLRRIMLEAGWFEADKLTLVSGIRVITSIIFNHSYQKAPVGPLFLFNRMQDMAFEIPTNPSQSARTRHHFRFWQLEEPHVSIQDHEHYSFWKQQLHRFTRTKRIIWIGAGTEEPHAVDFKWRNGQLTHGGSHDDGKERDFLIKTLKDAKFVKKISTTDRGDAVSFRGQQFRTVYKTDGSIRVVEIKSLKLRRTKV